MATDIFEDFGEKSQSLWDRLAMRDFEEVQSTFRNTQRSSPYVSPLYERNKPKDGSLLKLDQPLSFFSGDTNENSNFSYTYRVILCDNGSQVLDTYQKTVTNANEMVIICEKDDPNKSNLFGTFLLIKFGEKYRSMVNDLRNNVKRVIVSRKGQINGVEIDSFSDEVTDNHSILQKNGVTIERDKVEFAMNTELNITSSEGILLKTIFGGLEELIDWVTIGLSDQLEKIKFTEKDYVPQKKQEGLSFIEYLELLVELEVEAIKKVIDYAIPDEVEKVIAQSFDAALTNIKQYAKEKLPKGVLRLFEKAYTTIQECLNFFKEGCKKLAELVGEALLLFKALLMGFVNGLISTIQMLLQLIGWLIKFTSGINSYKKLTGESYRDMQSKFEFVEDIIDLISDKASDFFAAVKTLFLDFSLENMKEILKVFTGKASNLTPYHYAYYAGCFIFEVVLAVVLAIFTGGATAIAEAASMFEKVMATLKLVAREAFSVATMGIIDILQLFRVLITKFVQACKNGWAGFRDFLKKLMSNKTDDLAKEEGKLLDELGKHVDNFGDINKSFFENAGITLRREAATGAVLGQTEGYTCAANSLRMALEDLGIVRSEKYLADSLNTTRNGANILDIPKALDNAYVEGIKTISRGGIKDKNITVGTLEKLLKKGDKKAIVSVRTEEFGSHAIVVDKIEKGRVFVRDPLPLNQGSSYSITIEDFEKVFNKKFVTLKK